MKKKLSIFILTWLAIAIPALPALAQKDMPGSADHAEIPRIEGAIIYGYKYADFDEATFLFEKDGKLQASRPEGIRTQILYIVPGSFNIPMILKNYDTAFDALGEVEVVYRCSSGCADDFADGLVWQEDRRIPTTIKGTKYLYTRGNAPSYADQGYSYWTVATETTRYHVSIFSAFFTGKGIFRMEPDVKNTRSIHIDILEEADFSATLQVVTPDEINQSISEEGRIALYGILFEFDSDVLKPDALPALESISQALKDNLNLRIYVVGHTDNQGAYDYNLDLSKRRAASVIRALTSDYGVAANRLVAVGVGPVSPIASNRTEAGQALNRRVELVEQ